MTGFAENEIYDTSGPDERYILAAHEQRTPEMLINDLKHLDAQLTAVQLSLRGLITQIEGAAGAQKAAQHHYASVSLEYKHQMARRNMLALSVNRAQELLDEQLLALSVPRPEDMKMCHSDLKRQLETAQDDQQAHSLTMKNTVHVLQIARNAAQRCEFEATFGGMILSVKTEVAEQLDHISSKWADMMLFANRYLYGWNWT